MDVFGLDYCFYIEHKLAARMVGSEVIPERFGWALDAS